MIGAKSKLKNILTDGLFSGEIIIIQINGYRKHFDFRKHLQIYLCACKPLK